MPDKIESGGFSLIKKSWLVLTIVSFFVATGISIGVSQTQLSNKIDEKEARKIIREEFNNELKNYFSETDGRVLKTEIENLQKQIDRLEKIAERLQ